MSKFLPGEGTVARRVVGLACLGFLAVGSAPVVAACGGKSTPEQDPRVTSRYINEATLLAARYACTLKDFDDKNVHPVSQTNPYLTVARVVVSITHNAEGEAAASRDTLNPAFSFNNGPGLRSVIRTEPNKPASPFVKDKNVMEGSNDWGEATLVTSPGEDYVGDASIVVQPPTHRQDGSQLSTYNVADVTLMTEVGVTIPSTTLEPSEVRTLVGAIPCGQASVKYVNGVAEWSVLKTPHLPLPPTQVTDLNNTNIVPTPH